MTNSDMGHGLPSWRKMFLHFAALAVLAAPFAPVSVAQAQGLAQTPAPADVATYTTGPALPADDSVSRLPEVLGQGDVMLYRRIRDAQTAGDIAKADRLMEGLSDRRLIGHLLAERYLSKTYKTSYREAYDWLKVYGDHAEAARMLRLAAGKRLKTDPALPKLRTGAAYGRSGDEDMSWRDRPYKSANPGAGATALLKQADKLIRAGQLEAAAEVLDAARGIDPVLIDQQRGRIAVRAFQQGQDGLAVQLGREAVRSVNQVPSAVWYGGLAAWRMGRKAEAAPLFEAVAGSAYGSDWVNAAGAFWAGRAWQALGDRNRSRAAFEKAAELPHSLHGLMARRALGWDSGMDWDLPTLQARQVGSLRSFPALGRALALVQVGMREQAEVELRLALPKLPTDLGLTMLTLAERGGMPGLAMSIAGGVQRETGVRFDAALYPIPPWSPQTGFSVNPALVYAIARIESHFDPTVSNKSGATGLMQLMPGTAKAMSRHGRTVKFDGADDLFDPGLSMTLGQRLLHTLLTHKSVRGDLVRLSIAYNAGIGNMEKWTADARTGRDPLLLLEAIPSAETRSFSARMLHGYFLYQMRLGQQTDGLTALAAGRSPTYLPGQYAPPTIARLP